MAADKQPTENHATYREPRRGWQRTTVQARPPSRARETMRTDGPSPGQEVLAKHEAELEVQKKVSEPEPVSDQAAADNQSAQTFCF